MGVKVLEVVMWRRDGWRGRGGQRGSAGDGGRGSARWSLRFLYQAASHAGSGRLVGVRACVS